MTLDPSLHSKECCEKPLPTSLSSCLRPGPGPTIAGLFPSPWAAPAKHFLSMVSRNRWPFSRHVTFSRFTQVVACIITSSFLSAERRPVTRPHHVVCPSPAAGPLGCSPCWLGRRVLLRAPVQLRRGGPFHPPGVRSPVCLGSALTLPRTGHSVFRGAAPSIPPAVWGAPLCPHPRQHVLVSDFRTLAVPVGVRVRWCLRVVLVHVSQKASGAEGLLVCLLALPMFFLAKYLFRPFAPF